MKKKLLTLLVLCVSIFMFAIQGFANDTQQPLKAKRTHLSNLSWVDEGYGIHYILNFEITNSVAKHIEISNSVRTVNTDSELLEDRYCIIKVDDGRTYTAKYKDYFAGWSAERQALSRGIETCGSFIQAIPEGIEAGHSVTIEVYQRATSPNDIIQPQITLANIENPGPGDPLCIVYGLVVFNDDKGEEEYFDNEFVARDKNNPVLNETDDYGIWEEYLDNGKVKYSNSDEIFISAIYAEKTSSKVLINGKAVNFNAYNINDNNYFKLRDVAYALSGTEKQFDVDWKNNQIELIPNKQYTIVGGEMQGHSDWYQNAKLSSNTKIADEHGNVINNLFKGVYNIADNNYFKLRDIGKYFDFDVSWDSKNNTILIDTTKNYTDD